MLMRVHMGEVNEGRGGLAGGGGVGVFKTSRCMIEAENSGHPYHEGHCIWSGVGLKLPLLRGATTLQEEGDAPPGTGKGGGGWFQRFVA